MKEYIKIIEKENLNKQEVLLFLEQILKDNTGVNIPKEFEFLIEELEKDFIIKIGGCYITLMYDTQINDIWILNIVDLKKLMKKLEKNINNTKLKKLEIKIRKWWYN